MLEISEYVNLNGVKQYILATGNENGPLMLFLHGGPGVSQSGFIRKYQSKLEEDFLVVNWDQRGAGKSNTKIFSKISSNYQVGSFIHSIITRSSSQCLLMKSSQEIMNTKMVQVIFFWMLSY